VIPTVRRVLGVTDVPRALQDWRIHVALGFAVALAVADQQLLALIVLAVGAAALVAVTWAYPLPALVAVAVLLPFQQLVQSWLYEQGILDSSNATYLGYAKDGVLALVALRAWSQRGERRSTYVDQIAIALLALVLVYLILPIGAPFRVRYIAARGDVGFAIVFLAARWLPATAQLRDRTQRAVIASAGAIAAFAAWNRLRPEGWSDWIDSVGLVRFRRDVLEATTYNAVVRVDFGGSEVVRAGSLFLSPNDCAYFLLIGFAVVAGRFILRRSRPWEPWVGVLLAIGIFFTFSRSAMGLLLLVALIAAAGAKRVSRTAGLLAAGVVLVAVGAGLFTQRDEVQSGTDTSGDERTASHIEALGQSTERVLTRPLGSGLGTASATAIRFEVDDRLQNSENFYLRVGAQAGLAATLLVLGLVIATTRASWVEARRGSGAALVAVGGLAGVATGGLLLDTFSELAVAWTIFVLAGLALPAEPR
jgi:hypothetical protein